ncbi:MAG: permease [Bacteroidales bacterium]|nr:permease [Bacteroidales bacterium]
MRTYLLSLLNVVCEMGPYLLLGFLIAGLLHVFVPQGFYSKYLSKDNRWAVFYAALLGIPLPLCSCGVIPTAIGLRRENASKGAVASFLIATPQTGIDSILATYSLLGLGFAIVRPVAALITGVCGGLLVNRLVPEEDVAGTAAGSCPVETGNRLWRALKYAFYTLMQDIGGRLLVGLLLAALIQVAVPDDFFLHFGKQPLLQMFVILLVAVPMYICSTGSIPVAMALMMKGLSPGAALVMLMAGPAVNLASILVVRKSLGRRFTWIYLLTIVGFSVLFGLLINAVGLDIPAMHAGHDHVHGEALPGTFKLVCAAVLVLLLAFSLLAKLFGGHIHAHDPLPAEPDVTVYRVEGMDCSHCEAAVAGAVREIPGVESAEASASARRLTVRGTVDDEAVRAAVAKAGYKFKGREQR